MIQPTVGTRALFGNPTAPLPLADDTDDDEEVGAAISKNRTIAVGSDRKAGSFANVLKKAAPSWFPAWPVYARDAARLPYIDAAPTQNESLLP
jgi:hypothetical protein